jgi:hypothetical protein
MYVVINKVQGIELNGNTLSGNTFPAKDYIKAYLGGKWNASSKTWTVDADKVARWLNNTSNFSADNNPPTPKSAVAGIGGWCSKCHDWTYGDCGH